MTIYLGWFCSISKITLYINLRSMKWNLGEPILKTKKLTSDSGQIVNETKFGEISLFRQKIKWFSTVWENFEPN